MSRTIEYVDTRGRKYAVVLPDGVGDEYAESGVFLGPANAVDKMDLPEPIATRLHNELYRRKLYRLRDVERRASELVAALQAVFRLDAQALHQGFIEAEKESVIE